jgi:hypothetical protein
MTADPSPSPAGEIRLSHLIGGSLLVILGTAWLLQALDVIDVSWRQLLSLALVVVGGGLVWGSRWGRHGGLITLGVLLTVALVLASTLEVLLDVRLSGGVGERVIEHDDVEGRRLAVGSLTVDLRGGDFEEDVVVSVGIGEVIVIVDDPSMVLVEARAGIGEVQVFDRRVSGLGADLREGDPGTATYRLVVSAGIGRVEVRS